MTRPAALCSSKLSGRQDRGESMSNREAMRRAFEEYKQRADAARQARQEANQTRQLADKAEGKLQQAEQDYAKAQQEGKGKTKAKEALKEAEKPSKAAKKAEDKAKTAEKNQHLSKLKTKDSHQEGEDNGCVTRCVWEQGGRPPNYRPRCLFEGHNHKENAIKYHVANNQSWFNPSFERAGSRARKRLESQAKAVHLSQRAQKNNPLLTPGAWDMGMGGENFWGGSKKPWSHEAHHIIPTDVLYQAFKEDLGLLQQLKYNINKGINIIILPRRMAFARVYLLPAHNNSHGAYSVDVQKRVKRVRDAASKQQEKKEGHPEVSDAPNNSWKSQLENHSKQLRRVIRREGIRMGLTAEASNTLDDVFKPRDTASASG
ncbi:AHH domain-containing protein [Archangium sp.]|uniref:AHH domain-containing protein n=1 Tax=Archangium sp. TaxID=1872627 RepID=UPI0038998C58